MAQALLFFLKGEKMTFQTTKDKLYTYFNIFHEGKRYFIKVENRKLALAVMTEYDIKQFIIEKLQG